MISTKWRQVCGPFDRAGLGQGVRRGPEQHRRGGMVPSSTVGLYWTSRPEKWVSRPRNAEATVRWAPMTGERTSDGPPGSLGG